MTAKERFLLNEVARARLQELVNDPLLEHAMDAAMLEMMSQLPRHDSELINSNNFQKLAGARLFISVLQNLPVKAEASKRSAIGQLKE
jgi:hypothetical protein